MEVLVADKGRQESEGTGADLTQATPTKAEHRGSPSRPGPGSYLPNQFSRLLGLSRQELLENEKSGLLPQPMRTPAGIRYYRAEDIPRYRAYLGLPSPVRSQRRQLFLNFKGGTGKSSISASYGYRLAEMGIKTLMMDLDPQGHLTHCLGLSGAISSKTLYEVLAKGEDIRNVILKSALPTLQVLPSNLGLSPIDLALQPLNAREHRLKRAMRPILDDYEVIVMDASPSISLLNLNAILACNDLVIPVLADFLSYHGLKILFETLATIEEDFGFMFDNIHIFLNRYNSSHRICRRSRKALETHYMKYLLKTIVRQNTQIAEATSEGMTIFKHSPSSRGASDIDRLVREVMNI
jgi:chromosome partitioning protein